MTQKENLTASKAAAQVLAALPETRVEGFNAYAKLPCGTELYLGAATDLAFVRGTLNGIVDGNVTVGDPRLLSVMYAFIGNLEAATHSEVSEVWKASNPLGAHKLKMINTGDELVQTEAIAEKMAASLEGIGRFALATDKTPMDLRTPSQPGFHAGRVFRNDRGNTPA